MTTESHLFYFLCCLEKSTSELKFELTFHHFLDNIIEKVKKKKQKTTTKQKQKQKKKKPMFFDFLRNYRAQ